MCKHHSPERTAELLGISMDDAVVRNLSLKDAKLWLSRQGTVNEEVRRLEMRGVKGKLFNRVPPAAQSVNQLVLPWLCGSYTYNEELRGVRQNTSNMLFKTHLPRPRRCT